MDVLGITLSEECEEIYNQIMHNTHCRITFGVSHNHHSSCTEISNNFYKICLDTNVPHEYFEELLLHECIHIIQNELGYQDMLLNYNRLLCVYINNVILDIDVNRRLIHDFKFTRNNHIAQNILGNKIAITLQNWVENNIKPTNDEIKIMSLSLTYLELCYTKQYHQELFTIINVLYPDITIYFNQFSQIVQSHQETNYKTVREIQNKAKDLFEV